MKLKSNSRLLFIEESFKNLDLSKVITKIDHYLNNSIHLEKAYNEIIIQFQNSFFEIEDSNHLVKIGREIIGFDSAVFSEIKYTDLGQYHFEKFELEFSDDWENIIKQIKEIETKGQFNRLIINDDFNRIDAEFKELV